MAGGSGESVLLQPEENRRVAEVAVDQCRGRARIIMHVGAPTTSAAAGMAEQAARVGVDAVCALPGSFYGAGEDEAIGYYQAIGKAAGLPLFVYNLPDATGLEFTPELMKKLQNEVPQLTGLKHSAVNFRNVWIFAQMGLACLKGFSCLMLPALVEGAVGCVDGPPRRGSRTPSSESGTPIRKGIGRGPGRPRTRRLRSSASSMGNMVPTSPSSRN